MSRTKTRIAAVAGGCVLALAAAACGSSSDDNGTGSSSDSTQAVTGGTLNVLGTGDVDYMDPNVSYYSAGYLNLRMWSRRLFTYPASDGTTTTAVPDLATDLPTTANGGVSADGRTYTIKIGPARCGTPARPGR